MNARARRLWYYALAMAENCESEVGEMFDVVISGGTVIDGTGRRGFRADVGIEGDRIGAVGDLRAADARRVVNGDGALRGAGLH